MKKREFLQSLNDTEYSLVYLAEKDEICGVAETVSKINKYIEEQKEKERCKEARRRARKETFWYVMSVIGIALLISAMLALFVSIIVAGYTGQLTVYGKVVPGFVGLLMVLPMGCVFVIFNALIIRNWLGD